MDWIGALGPVCVRARGVFRCCCKETLCRSAAVLEEAQGLESRQPAAAAREGRVQPAKNKNKQGLEGATGETARFDLI